ncbi:circadian clock-controlled protein daywake-like [Cochliomyia hominivorax]
MLTTTPLLSYIFLINTIFILIPSTNSFELPFLQSCTIEDQECHVKYVDKFFEMYGNGIEGLDMPSLDPMHLGDITIKGNNNENFNLELIMENVDLYKFPILKCLSIKGFSKDDTKPMKVVMKTLSPQLIIKAHCRIKGKLLLFTVAGETDIIIDVRNVTTTMVSKASPYTKDGKVYYKTDELRPKLDIGSLKTKFSNSTLFNGEEVFMETFADTINNNWQVLRDEIEPHLNNAVAKVALEAVNKVMETMPYEKFFKKSE